jgi:hypothetical protein
MEEILLRNRQGHVVGVALVDSEDGHLVDLTWSLHSAGYAYRLVDRHAVYMHRVVLGLERGNLLQGDHINGNRLDNRRANLRVVTSQEQSQNICLRKDKQVSRYRGVFYDKRRKKWYGQVQLAGKKHSTGQFLSEDEAGEAVKVLRERLHPFAIDR